MKELAPHSLKFQISKKTHPYFKILLLFQLSILFLSFINCNLRDAELVICICRFSLTSLVVRYGWNKAMLLLSGAKLAAG